MLKKRKAAALIMAVVVMMVFTILGTALLMVSSSEAKIVSLQSKRIQAYYFARAGAESALKAWKDAVETGSTKPLGDSPQYFLKSSGSFTTEPDNLGYFKVKITNVDANTTKIESTGNYLDISQKVTITITGNNKHRTGLEVFWYKDNGKIIYGPHSHEGGIVVVDVDKLKNPNTNVEVSTFDSDVMFFEGVAFNPFHNILNLISNIIVMNETTLDLLDPGNASSEEDLIVKIPSNGGFKIGKGNTYIDGNNISHNVAGKTYGIIYCKLPEDTKIEGYYYPGVSGGISLKTQTSELIKMNKDDPYYNIPSYNNNYTYIWS